MHVKVVGGPVGEIEQGEGRFTPNHRYRACSLNIAGECKLLAVVVEVVHRLRSMCTLRWWVARLVRLSGERGDSPQIADTACTHPISSAHANDWRWW